MDSSQSDTSENQAHSSDVKEFMSEVNDNPSGGARESASSGGAEKPVKEGFVRFVDFVKAAAQAKKKKAGRSKKSLAIEKYQHQRDLFAEAANQIPDAESEDEVEALSHFDKAADE